MTTHNPLNSNSSAFFRYVASAMQLKHSFDLKIKHLCSSLLKTLNQFLLKTIIFQLVLRGKFKNFAKLHKEVVLKIDKT